MSIRNRVEELERARLEAVWEEARVLPAQQRESLLESVSDDPALRSELESLLSRADRAETFFGRFGAVMQEVVEAAAQEDVSQVTEAQFGADPLPGQTVGHYQIEARLGEGGMGVVYRARDTRLQRTVALKFLPARVNADSQAQERFLIEARAAAALDHINICNIHEVGGHEQTRSFIAMAFYPGETLEQVLTRGPLPLVRALDYAKQIARGLSAAHKHGIVHRDVKPGNVMITAEHVVKLLDFGIARLPDGSVSRPGITPGTIAYMSPEQVRSRPVDQRTDLWSLGVLLYEMCTGVRPFSGDDQGATLHAILNGAAARASSLRPEVPEHIDAVIDRLLRKDARERYASADELLADLEVTFQPGAPQQRLPASGDGGRSPAGRAALVAAMIGLVTVGGWLLWSRAAAAPARILIADAEGDTLSGRTVTERLRQSLASPELTVAGRPSLEAALVRMGREPTVRLTPETARELAIREGFPGFVHVTVDRIGKGFAIAAILVEAETGDLMDHQQATAMNAAELTAATDRLAAGLRRSFDRSLTSLADQPPLLAVTTDSISALRRHLEAVQANRNGDFQRGIQLHDETITIDPRFADAHQTRAFALEQIGLRAGRAQSSIMQANALRAGLTRHERYIVEADYSWQVEGDLGRAIASLRQAHQAIQEVQPGRVLNRRSYGLALMLHGDMAQAESVLQEGRRFAPCPATSTHLVSVLHALDQDAEARAVLDAALDQWPTNPFLGMDRAHFLATAGRYRDAHDVARRLEHGYTSPFALRAEAVVDAVEGRLDEALDHLEELRDDHIAVALLTPALEVAAAIGRVWLVAGDTARGVKQLEDFLVRHPLHSLEAAERPYLSLALFFADARRPDRARQLLADYDALVPGSFKGPDRWMQRRVRASLLLASDSPDLALSELREAAKSDRIWTHWLDHLLFLPADRPDLARVYDRLGQADSAIVVFERYLNAKVLYRTELDAFHLAHALRRLAILHAQRNQPARAAHYQRPLQELWRNADPRLKRTWRIA